MAGLYSGDPLAQAYPPSSAGTQASTDLSVSSQATSTTSTFQEIWKKALDEYKGHTGESLEIHALYGKLKGGASVDNIMLVLHDQIRDFTEFRECRVALVKRLKPLVSIVLLLSDTLGQGISLTFPPAGTIFAGIGVLLGAINDVSDSFDGLVDLFDRIGNFLVRLNKFTQFACSVELKAILAKTLAQVIVIFGIATKQISRGRLKKYGKKLLGTDTDVEDALKKLDGLTMEESRVTAMDSLGLIHGLMDMLKSGMQGV